MARRAARPHARPQGHLRRPGPPLRRHRRAGRGHPGQPDLPEPDRDPVGHPGVHGHGEALRAGRGGRVRPGRGGHPPVPQRPRLPRRPPPADPLPREPALPGADDAHPGRAAVHGGGRPGAAADHLQGGRGRHRRTTRSPSSRPSRGWRRGSATGPPGSASCWPSRTTAFVLVASPRPDSVDEAVHFADKLAESEMSVDRPGRQPGPAPLRRRRPAGRPLPAPATTGPAALGDSGRQPAGLHGGLGPRGAGLRRPGGRGGARPGLPGAPAQHRRPRPRRAGHRRRPPVRRPR